MPSPESRLHKTRPVIGVFDSGFGGLTVLRELVPLIPSAHFVYLGDTARLPYGAKSPATVARYAVSSALFLAQQGAELLVIACNTATALALPEIRAAVNIPVIGVIEPGAQAAASAMRDEPKAVLVLATAATVQSHAYREACRALGLTTHELACPLLVPLVEEGWIDHHVTREVLHIYLAEALAQVKPSAVLLGCTHYPLLREQIARTLNELGSSAKIIDSAEATAHAVLQQLDALLPEEGRDATFTCFATDSTDKFQRLGSRFLGRTIAAVELVNLGE